MYSRQDVGASLDLFLSVAPSRKAGVRPSLLTHRAWMHQPLVLALLTVCRASESYFPALNIHFHSYNVGILQTQRHSHAEPRLLRPLCLSSASYGGFRSWETVKPLLFQDPLSPVALGESPSSVCEETEGADEAHREGRSCGDETTLASRPGVQVSGCFCCLSRNVLL